MKIVVITTATISAIVILTCFVVPGASGNPPGGWRKDLPEPVLGEHSEWVDLYYDTWRIADRKTTEYCGETIFDTAFTTNRIWMWDTVWISLFGVYSQNAHPRVHNPMHGFDVFYSKQRKDGCIPHVYDATGNHNFDIHNPIFTLGEMNYYRHVGDVIRLERVLPILDRLFVYVKKKYSREDGLYRQLDWNNGMDNRPCGAFSIDAACEQAMVAEQIMEMARTVGDKNREKRYEEEYNELKKIINSKMWHESDRFYADCNNNAEPVNYWSVASYWAFLSGVATKERAELMKQHLFDPENFKTPMMVPTLGRKSSGYDKDGGDYWCGAVWVPSNTMVIRGLQKYGYINEARQIAINGLDGMYKTWQRTGTLFENYDQERAGLPGETSKKDFVGWSGVQPIATLIETIIGISADAPENTIRWSLRLIERHGIRNLKWGPCYSRTVSLVADSRSSLKESVSIDLETNAPFVLVVDTGTTTNRFDLKKTGRHTIRIEQM